MQSPTSHSRTIRIALIPLFVATMVLAACGGGGGGGTIPTPITSFELLDPTPGAGDEFGNRVVILANGNIVVSDPFDSSVAPHNGAVHLYNPITQALIASIYGDMVFDNLGSNGITALANGNFVIASAFDEEGGVINAGSVRLVNGTTGTEISAIVGDTADEFLGSNGSTALANNNFVVVSAGHDEGGVINAGSVRLVNGTTGVPIGSPIVGDVAGDLLGISGITALANNNFVIASQFDNEGGVINAGSVRLVDGATGVPIGSPIVGDVAFDQLGTRITALANSNFVIASEVDDEGGVVDAGSARLVNGVTGAPIGSPIVGDVAGDQLGISGITALANNNFVIASELDDEGGVVDVGSVRLVNGVTGAPIGSPIAGDVANDVLGSNGITALVNGHFVIASEFDDEGGVVDAGSARLVNGATGTEINAIVGDTLDDRLGFVGITALANGHFVIASPFDDEGGVINAGSARLVDGATGVPIGSPFVGDVEGDFLGSNGITALANNNFVIASQFDNEGGVINAGSVRLVDGATGVPIGSPIVGDVAFDQLGTRITALANSNFVIASEVDDEGGVVDAGSARLVDGATGVPIGSTITGTVVGDMFVTRIIGSTTGDFYILSLSRADNNGAVDSGLVRLIAQ